MPHTIETLMNGGRGSNHEWGQTLQEVTVHFELNGLRARDLIVDIRRQHIRVAPKRGGESLLEGALAKPVRCDESTWMIEDGVLVLQLAKDNMRAENTGPSTEWWAGLFEGEETVDKSGVNVGDYVNTTQLRPEELARVDQSHHMRAEAHDSKERQAAKEAALDPERLKALEGLRAQFPDIPIEWGDTDMPDAAAER